MSKEETTGDFIQSIVTPEWIKKKMIRNKLKQRDIVSDTGISKTNISTWMNGKRPMSMIVKALFWYYFVSIEN